MLELYDLEKLVAFRREGTLVAASEKLLISRRPSGLRKTR